MTESKVFSSDGSVEFKTPDIHKSRQRVGKVISIDDDLEEPSTLSSGSFKSQTDYKADIENVKLPDINLRTTFYQCEGD